MAYVLGLIYSDGNIYETTLSWQLQTRDKELLFKIRNSMESDYPIEFSAKKNAVRLRISNPSIIESLKQFKLASHEPKFPHVQIEFLRDFIRGFLDGDGWITANPTRYEISVGFVGKNYGFLNELIKRLNNHILLTSNNLRTKKRITEKGKLSTIYSVEWYGTNALNILKFLYDDLKGDDLYLERKYKRQLEARSLYIEIRKGRKWREIENKYSTSIERLFFKLYVEKKLNGVQIAEALGASSATAYRWLEKTGIRLPIKRKLVLVKCLICGTEFKQRGSKKYCSLTCAGRDTRTGKPVKCTICGKEIYRPRWWFRENVYPLCSSKCCKRWHAMLLKTGVRHRCQKTGRFLPGVFSSFADQRIRGP